MYYSELTHNQRRIYVDGIQLYEAYRDAVRRRREFAGGMYWKKVSGKDYLIKLIGREGRGRSLGPRSPETERILAEFTRSKAEIVDRVKSLRERLDEQARFHKAGLIARVPNVVARILHLLEDRGMLGKNVIVIGATALYAYEAAAGVMVHRKLMATTDMDLLWDTRSKLKLATDLDERGMVGILKRADKSFEIDTKQKFRAANKDGFLVDLIKQTPNPPWKAEPHSMGANDLVATEIWNMQWLLNAPKLEQIAIAQDGIPVPISAPDPRAFALFKYWLAQSKERDPVKKQRDAAQASVVAEIVVKYLPQLPFSPEQMRMFPLDIVEQNAARMESPSLPEQ